MYIMLYLNSVSSVYNEIEEYYRFTLPRPITTDNKTMSLRLVEAEIPLTYFNIITGYNDFLEFKVTRDGGFATSRTWELTIPQKNYSVQEMLVTLNALIVEEGATFSNLTTSISFNSQTLRFSIDVISSNSAVSKVGAIELLDRNNTTTQKILGSVPAIIAPNAGTGTLQFPNSINMNRTKNIYLFTTDFGLDTRSNTNSTNNNSFGRASPMVGGSILSKVQASEPFGSIVSYQSESENYININPRINYIDHIDIYLRDDENHSLYLNGVNFCMSLVFKEGDISNTSTREPRAVITQLSM